MVGVEKSEKEMCYRGKFSSLHSHAARLYTRVDDCAIQEDSAATVR